jgi:primosomal protein N' (replication factor Y) (superfamily II helicase)
MMYADVIIPLNLSGTLTYGVPVELHDSIAVGMRVEVNLGKSKIYTGVVYKLHNNKPDAFLVKPILNIIDDQAILSTIHLAFWDWLHQYYCCNYGEILTAVLPTYMKLSSETMLILNDQTNHDELMWSNDEFYILEALRIKEILKVSEIRKLIKNKNVTAVINKLIHKNAIFSFEDNKQGYRPKTENIIMLSDSYDNEGDMQILFNELEKAPKQLHLLLTYLNLYSVDGQVKQTELIAKSKATATQLKSLVDKGVLLVIKQQVNRVQLKADKAYAQFTLSLAQQKAYLECTQFFKLNKPILLHGVTGSGKTNIHIQVAKDCIANGQQVLYLLPEIALTVQLINRLYSQFGDALAVYHSKYSNNERVEIWEQVQSNKAQIILGARSALFLPFQNLGIIIVDEEHDSSYKQQDPSPRYHARDAAIVLSTLFKANILLSSATPSLESYYNCKSNKYGLVQLSEKYAQTKPPQIDIINNKVDPTIKRMSNVFTNELIAAIEVTLKDKKQVLLFQNRRGYAPYLYCSSCGWNAHCNNCDVALNYHKVSDKLHCHYCGTKWAIFKSCPSCKSIKLYYKNYGTERIEDEIKKIFPTAVVDRLDADTARTKNKFQNIIRSIDNNITDILVGTQMIVKGLDFENVQLVGVISADSLINKTDFRAHEKGFQTLCQVSGRAGRKYEHAKVILQALNTTNPILKSVQDDDYYGFIHEELTQRKEFNYPPFCSLVKIILKHKNNILLNEAAVRAASFCKTIDKVEVLGPSEPVIARIQNWYALEIVLKCPKNKAVLKYVKEVVANFKNSFMATKGNSGFQFNIDIDPL